MSEVFAMFERATARFGALVHAVDDAQWTAPTACAQWDVRELVNHVVVEQLWVPPLVEGKSVSDVGASLDGDQLGADPVAAWDAARDAAVASLGAPGALEGTVSLSRGPMPTADYAWEMTTDALVHSWDLARGIGGDETLDADIVAAVYERVLPHVPMLQESGMFAAPVAVPDDASPQTKLLAAMGRRASS